MSEQLSVRDLQQVGPDRETAGPAWIVQGVYGERGNLELVVPDVADGLWVFWWNSDAVTVSGVEPGRWSGGLRFATGARYLAASIHQIPLGPDHLEVLALADDGVLQSWFWSPGPGFQRRAADAATGVTRFTASPLPDGTLHAHVEGGSGVRLVTAGPDGYPERTWTGTPVDVMPPEPADLPDAVPGTTREAASSLDGGRRELAWRDAAGRLWHGHATPVE